MPNVIVSMTEVFKLQDIADETIRAEFVRNSLTSGHPKYRKRQSNTPMNRGALVLKW